MQHSFGLRSLHRAARLGVVLSLLTGCPGEEVPTTDDSSSSGDTNPGVCVPGAQVNCSCPGTVDGIQVCLPNGSGYGSCECGPPPADSGTDAGSDDTTSTTTSGMTETIGPPTGTGSTDTGSTDTGSTDTGTTGTGTTSTGSTSTGSTGTGTTSTGTTSTGSESGSESGSTSGGGVCDMYMGGVGTMCDPWLQDCPAGEKCIAYAAGGGSWDSTHCWPIDPSPGQPGDVCTVQGSGTSGEDDCDLGAMCWDVDPATNMGVCVALCNGCPDEPQCDDPGTACVISNNDVLTLCLPTCDPLLQDCVAGQACYPVNDTFLCAPDASGAMGVYGDPCEFINVCDPGLVCLDPTAVPGCVSPVGCCTEICDVTDPAGDAQCTGAPGGQQCVAWYAVGMAPPGFEDVGVCTL